VGRVDEEASSSNGCSVADYDSCKSAGIVSPTAYARADNVDKD
jgi:hypothetical protein